MSTGSTRTTRSPGFAVPFRYYFCQREAIETLVWLVEIAGIATRRRSIQASRDEVYKRDLFTDNIVFQTTMDGRRQLRRYVPELDARACRTCRRESAALRFQDGHRLGQDLGDRDGCGLVTLPQEARPGFGRFPQTS